MKRVVRSTSVPMAELSSPKPTGGCRAYSAAWRTAGPEEMTSGAEMIDNLLLLALRSTREW